MKLHHLQGSRSCRVRWLLEELDISYELESYVLGDGALKSDAYLSKNPMGLVPTLEDGAVTLFESGAIVQYLLERYGEGRLEPAVGDPARSRYLQWFHWAEASLMLPLFDVMRHRFLLPEAERSEWLLANARKRFARHLEILERELSGADQLLAAGFSAADIMTAFGLQLAKMVGELPEEYKNVSAYLARMAERPAFQRAFGDGFGS